jgi:nucleosome assembly protein 1-like 1
VRVSACLCQAERRALEAKYEGLYAPLYAKRASLVTGATDCEHPAEDKSEAPAGVPEFWRIAMCNHESLAEAITEKDAAILAYLEDGTCTSVTGTDEDGDPTYGFCLTFKFAAGNPYMTSTEVTKTYGFSDEEQEYLLHSKGSPIAWLPAKDPTVKVLKKKGTKPGAKPQTKIERTPSFFSFFTPPEVPEDGGEDLEEEEMEELQDAMEMDHELGRILKDDIIPDAVAWFTGAALEGDDEDDEEEYDEDEDDGDDDDDHDDDDEDEEDEPPSAPAGRGRGAKPGKGPGGAEGNPEECKQQ